MAKVLNYRVLVEQDEDGFFVVSVPSLQGCYTEGKTYEEAIKNITDVINLHLEERKNAVTDDSKTEFIGIKNISIPYGSLAAN
jgi:predicted RNase H-like HicB family nuclease